MHRLWVRWALLIAFVAALGTAFVNLGEWQLDRLHQRRERNSFTVHNEQQPVRPWTDVFTRPIGQPDEWQRVSVTGTFDGAHQIVVRYRSTGDTDGYEVVTPLQTPSGNVLVDRGVVPVGSGGQIPATAPAPPTGQVTVVGHVRADEPGRSSARTPVNGSVRLVDSRAIAKTLPYPVVDGYIGLLSVDPGQTGGFLPVETPEISDGPHFWYAVQWFMFTGIGVLGVVVFIRGDLRERRTGSRKGQPSPDGPQPELTSSGV